MMDRRDFVSALISSSVALLVPLSPCLATGEALMACVPIRNIPPGFDVRSLGEEYLKVRPRLRERSILIEEILDEPASLTSESSAREFLRKSIANDFDRGMTLSIKGWVYAETELKLCALHTLTMA